MSNSPDGTEVHEVWSTDHGMPAWNWPAAIATVREEK